MEETVADNNELVIVGAGICGLATALALHKKGIKSLVTERSEYLRNTTGAAIGIWPNGWRALHQLGVADKLRQCAFPLRRVTDVWLDEDKQKEMSMSGELRCLTRKDLIDTLNDALPPATVKFGCHLESIRLHPVTYYPILRLTDGSSITAKVVIGYDGANSIVADFLGLKPTKLYSICAVRGLTHYANGHSFHDDFTRLRKANNVVGRAPINNNLVYWFALQPYCTPDERIWEDPELIKQSTLELLRDYPQEIQEMIKSADVKSLSLTHIRYRAPWDLLPGTFRKGTITVAGDAMHVMGPFLGQGGLAGLEDAVVLARNLAQIASSGLVESGRKVVVRKVPEAFDCYVKERRVRLVRLSLRTYLTGILFENSSWIQKLICIVLLGLLFRNPSGHIDYDCGVL